MKNADPLAPMAMGRHSDSPTTKASAMSPVAHPMSATPRSHVAVFCHEFLGLVLWSGMFWGSVSSSSSGSRCESRTCYLGWLVCGLNR